jgi:hypothetical protein
MFYTLLQAHEGVREEHVEQVGHRHIEALGPLVELADVFIGDFWLIEPMPRHTRPPQDGSRAGEAGLVCPGGRKVGFAGVSVLDGWQDSGIVKADDFTVRAEVVVKPLDA